ncbi:CdaR family protein [Desulfovibrionales bacterium]
MKNNWQYRILALLMALACWYVVSGQEKVETWLEVPVEFVNLPQQMEITSGLVNKIQVRIRGTSNQVRSLNVGRLAYKLDLGKIQVGTNVLPLLAESMTITSAVDVVEISPTRLELVADIMVSKTVPVHLDWHGLPAEDMHLENASIIPAQVEITGFTTALQNIRTLSSTRIDVPATEERTLSGQARLLLPKDVRAQVSSVGYELTFAPVTQELWVKMNLEAVEYGDYSYTFDPKHVRVKLDIPVSLLKNKDWRETLHLVLDPGAFAKDGQSIIQPVPRLPSDVRVLEMKPAEVEIFVHRSADSIMP